MASDEKQLTRKVYEGDLVLPVKMLGITIMADAENVTRYNEAVTNLKQALARLSNATRAWQKSDEKNIIDQ